MRGENVIDNTVVCLFRRRRQQHLVYEFFAAESEHTYLIKEHSLGQKDHVCRQLYALQPIRNAEGPVYRTFRRGEIFALLETLRRPWSTATVTVRRVQSRERETIILYVKVDEIMGMATVVGQSVLEPPKNFISCDKMTGMATVATWPILEPTTTWRYV
jgi:hypothetical protein